MVCSTSRVDNRTKAARERVVAETDSRESKKATPVKSYTKSLHSEIFKLEEKCINASPNVNFNQLIYSFRIIEK